jgi:glucose uptake protein
MFVIKSYRLAVIFCVVTMLCWGSWSNTLKLADKLVEGWRFELFYWDYVFGVLLMAVIFALTMGSIGQEGRNFLADVRQAARENVYSAFLGGMVFNAANILLVAAIAVAGMAVAFPVGIGLALVLGVVVNYLAQPKGEPLKLFGGVALIVVAILLCAWAYSMVPPKPGEAKASPMIGLGLAVLCGLLMGFFYRFVAAAMPEPKPENFINMPPGKLSPYSAMVFFSVGILASQLLFNFANILGALTAAPFQSPEYFCGTFWVHLCGVLGGMIWAVGMTFSIIAFGRAGPAISYGLGQGATLVAAFWGVFIWLEFAEAFKESPWITSLLILLMFAGYLGGLALIILAGMKTQEQEPA